MRVLALALLFASGLFDAAILKKKGLACVTWFMGIVALTVWISHSWTTASILAGAVVLASGVIVLIVYYRGWLA
jgi:hypothetical protein